MSTDVSGGFYRIRMYSDVNSDLCQLRVIIKDVRMIEKMLTTEILIV